MHTQQQTVYLACALEATAPKVGNVQPGASFDDLCYEDMLQSGLAIAEVFRVNSSRHVGQITLDAVLAMRKSVHTNAHLGTILLLAPLVVVPRQLSLQAGVSAVIECLSAEDTRCVYEAIRITSPGGLGDVDWGDVRADVPKAPLGEVMSWAKDRDSIALQYTNGFETVFTVASALHADIAGNMQLLDAIVRQHVQLIATHGDSLIARKCGQDAAIEAQQRAQRVLASGPAGGERYHQHLHEFDTWLRDDGHRRNPGTTADLIAAALFVLLREGELSPDDAQHAIDSASTDN